MNKNQELVYAACCSQKEYVSKTMFSFKLEGCVFAKDWFCLYYRILLAAVLHYLFCIHIIEERILPGSGSTESPI